MADYTIDIRKPSTGLHTETFRLNDNGLRTLRFHLCEGSEPFIIPSDSQATLFALLPDSAATTVYTSCDIDENAVKVNVASSTEENAGLTSCPGEVRCELRITSSEGKVLTSPCFSFTVEEVLQNDSAIEAQESFSALTDALARVLIAESGLSQKTDKVPDAEGTTAVFCEDGGISSSGLAPTAVFVFTFGDEGTYDDPDNRLMLEALTDCENRGIGFCTFIKTSDSQLLPATVTGAQSRKKIVAQNEFCDTLYTVSFLSSNQSYETTTICNYESSLQEDSDVPASQQVVAQWVKEYVDLAVTEGEW